jgi:hypothetical protein
LCNSISSGKLAVEMMRNGMRSPRRRLNRKLKERRLMTIGVMSSKVQKEERQQRCKMMRRMKAEMS